MLQKAPKASANRTVTVLCFGIAIWILSAFLSDFPSIANLSLTFNRLVYLGLVPALTALLYLPFVFPKQRKISSLLKVLVFVFCISTVFLAVFTNAFVSSVTLESWGSNPISGNLTWILSAYSVLVTLISFAVLFLNYRQVKGHARTQLQFFLLGIILFFFTVMFVYLGLRAIVGSDQYYRLGNYSAIIFVVTTAYAIIAQRLFDIRVIIRRTVVFTGLSAFVLSVYALIVFIGATLAGSRGVDAFTADTFVPSLIAALVIAVGFDPIRRWLSSTTDRWLFKGEYSSQEVLTDLSKTVASAVNLSEAIKQMIEVVVKSMRLTEGVAFLVQPSEDKKELELKEAIVVGEQNKIVATLEAHDPLIEFFRHEAEESAHEQHNPVVVEELAHKIEQGDVDPSRSELSVQFLSRLNQLGAAVALPLYITRQQPKPSAPGTPTTYESVETFMGVLVLGEKRSGDMFSEQDVNLLGIVANETSNAVEKSRLFEEDQLKTEFVAVASHELLTPTAAMEGYLSMILDEGKGTIDDEAHKYLDIVYKESKRLAGLVKDLLNVSRIERGKFVVNLKSVDLTDAIKTGIDNLALKAKERQMKVLFTPTTEKLPNATADPEKLTEIIMNLVGNAIKYTPEGGSITVSLAQRDDKLITSVTDNGIGIKPEDMTHLFEKFYRASNSDSTAQTGTGLGLYITRNEVELMGGVINVKSELGKGSTFTFSLPIAK